MRQHLLSPKCRTMQSRRISSFTTSSTQSLRSTQNTIAKTLYRQLLRWSISTGFEVPFDPALPPLTLKAPIINASSLKKLATCTKSGECLTDSEEIRNFRRISQLLPRNSVVDSLKLVIPIEKAAHVQNVTRFVYRLNMIDSEEVGEDDSVIKSRISLGFEVTRSLNQLNGLLEKRKEARLRNRDRKGVLFNIGQGEPYY